MFNWINPVSFELTKSSIFQCEKIMNIGYLKAILFIIKIIKALLPTFFDTKEALKKNRVSKFIILGSRKVSHNLNK